MHNDDIDYWTDNRDSQEGMWIDWPHPYSPYLLQSASYLYLMTKEQKYKDWIYRDLGERYSTVWGYCDIKTLFIMYWGFGLHVAYADALIGLIDVGKDDPSM